MSERIRVRDIGRECVSETERERESKAERTKSVCGRHEYSRASLANTLGEKGNERKRGRD